MQRESQKDRTILCKYEPTEPGDYRLEVKWSGENVPGSPFMVMIFDTQEELTKFLQVRSKKVLLLVLTRGPFQFFGSFKMMKNFLVSFRVATLPPETSVRCTAALETTPPTLREVDPITQGLATDAFFMLAFSCQLIIDLSVGGKSMGTQHSCTVNCT